jgi:hypothetical protein
VYLIPSADVNARGRHLIDRLPGSFAHLAGVVGRVLPGLP